MPILNPYQRKFYRSSLLHVLAKSNSFPKTEKMTISGFLSDCKKDKILTEKEYIYLLVVLPSLSDNEKEKYVQRTIGYIPGLFCYQILNNKQLTNEEERIIRKAFALEQSIINYKILKSGFSGAKVVEAQLVKGSLNSARFVIKFAKKVTTQGISGIQEVCRRTNRPILPSKYEETEQYEAIKYAYASQDNRKDHNPTEGLPHELISE